MHEVSYITFRLYAQQTGVDKSRVDTCMSDSGGTEGDNKNTILEDELLEKVRGFCDHDTAEYVT